MKEGLAVRNFKLILTAVIVLSCLCISGLPQNSTPIGIRPEPPEGKGVVVLKAARLIDATGAAQIKNAVSTTTPLPSGGSGLIPIGVEFCGPSRPKARVSSC